VLITAGWYSWNFPEALLTDQTHLVGRPRRLAVYEGFGTRPCLTDISSLGTDSVVCPCYDPSDCA
ncbi:MAG: hypothetical protein ACKVLN_01360, partial [Rhodobacterales bacterium]